MRTLLFIGLACGAVFVIHGSRERITHAAAAEALLGCVSDSRTESVNAAIEHAAARYAATLEHPIKPWEKTLLGWTVKASDVGESWCSEVAIPSLR